MSSPTLRELAEEVMRLHRGCLALEKSVDEADVDLDRLIDLAPQLARAVLASPAVESAPAASGWRKEPPTVEEVRAGQTWWWMRGGDLVGEQVDRVFIDAHNRVCLLGVNYYPLPIANLTGREDMEWSPCLPPSAPAADAGIVARYTATVTDLCEPDPVTNFPTVVVCAGPIHGEDHVCVPPTVHSLPAWTGAAEGQRVEVLVRVLGSAARRNIVECDCPSYPCEHNPRGNDLAQSEPDGSPKP
jgi:hypothetical protein